MVMINDKGQGARDKQACMRVAFGPLLASIPNSLCCIKVYFTSIGWCAVRSGGPLTAGRWCASAAAAPPPQATPPLP
eukprot:8581058-Pyramimonas_sp.AAC.1